MSKLASYLFYTRINSKTSFHSPGFSKPYTGYPANLSSVGKPTIDLIAIIKIRSQLSCTFQAHSTRREDTRRVNNTTITRVPRHCLQISVVRLVTGIDFEHRHQSNSNLFYLFKQCWSIMNMMMLGLKSGPQIAAKTGIPAGLLFRRIWYSVWKSGVLGITEYRQGRPLLGTRRANYCISGVIVCYHLN